jgi:hypothetical protein
MAAQQHTDTKVPRARVEIEVDELDALRHSLLMGLACYGEIDRLLNQAGTGIPEGAVIDPSGDPGEVGRFANALILVEHLAHQITQANGADHE